MSVVGLIPARAGSRRLPNKNLAILGGRPLIAHTCAAARASSVLTAIYVNTDSPDIARVAEQCGVPCPVLRPAHLAADETPTRDAIVFMLDYLARRGEHYDAAMILQPTSPLRTAEDIRAALTLFEQNRPCAVASVGPVAPRSWLGCIAEHGSFQRWTGEDVAYRLNGALYIHDMQDYLENRPAARTLAYVMPPARGVDIDDADDLALAEALLHQRQSQPAPVQIGPYRVGDGERVLIIAEAGVNHDGSLDQALRLVDVAVEAGADVVKFQMFRADELTTRDAPAAGYQRAAGDESQHAMLQRLELTDDDFARIAAHCRSRGVLFLVTPFGPADVDRLLRLEVSAIKLASTDINNVPLLQRATETGLPLIVSTGAATRTEIAVAVERLQAWGVAPRTVLLHCISGYPAPLAAANLRAVAALCDTFHLPAGFSDHTRSTDIAGWAVAAGARVLEKHFTLDPAAPGPDHAMSLDPQQLAAYVAAARQAEAALGTGRLGMSDLEADVRAVARKSVVAACRLTAGTVLTPGLLAIKRPDGGIPPDRLDELLGRCVTRDIAPDTVLTWDMVR